MSAGMSTTAAMAAANASTQPEAEGEEPLLQGDPDLFAQVDPLPCLLRLCKLVSCASPALVTAFSLDGLAHQRVLWGNCQ